MTELSDEEMCAVFGHRMRLIGRTVTGQGVTRCRRCRVLNRPDPFTRCVPGTIKVVEVTP